MKWIGQHIYDLVSRFRDDVYLEDLSTTTQTNVLVVDSTGKVSKSTTLADDIIEAEIDTLPKLTSFGLATTTTNVLAGDLTMYNTVNDGNPTISLGSSATNRFEISVPYNSGTQTLCDVDFKTYTASGTTNDGRFTFYVDEVQLLNINDGGMSVYGTVGSYAADALVIASDSTASSATQGGSLTLQSNDGAAMGDDHRLGVIEFKGAEDASSNLQIGASIQAMCDAAWSASENGTRLEFYTMDGNAASELSLTLDSDLLATFAGGVTVTGTITGDVTGDLTGEAATVATIAGLAPNTATTQATQAAITTCANLVTVGTIGTGVWNATAIASAKMATGTISAQGALELATTAEAITGTDTARAVTPAGLKARVSQIVNLKGYATLQNDVFDYANAYNSDDEAPFQLDESYGSGTINSSTTVNQGKLFRAGGFHVPFACTISDIQAQLTCNNDGNVSIAVVEYRPNADANTDYPRVVYETVVVDSENNNNKVSSTTIATGDLDNTAVLAGSHLLLMVKGDGTSVGGTAIFSVAIGLSW